MTIGSSGRPWDRPVTWYEAEGKGRQVWPYEFKSLSWLVLQFDRRSSKPFLQEVYGLFEVSIFHIIKIIPRICEE